MFESHMEIKRRYPIGAEIQEGGGTHFQVWAPECLTLDLVIEGGAIHSMARTESGYFSFFVKDAGPGTRYRFQKNNFDFLIPDPASRYQPDGPKGPSQVIDPFSYSWQDKDWKGCELKGQIFYEMHVGTFTQQGTWSAAIAKLPYLKDLGVTCIEIMPLAEFPGKFGWGYDGVSMFAPFHHYGTPNDVRKFVDAAHKLELGVILDVVYNHFGPDGNFLRQFSSDYFTNRYVNEWGESLNFDGTNSQFVREFFLTNAYYWLEEFHYDGFRVDATQAIQDSSPVHFLQELIYSCRKMYPHKKLLFIAENEPQKVHLIKDEREGGFDFDAIWNDDYHHAWYVALTGHREAYYADYQGTMEELVAMLQWGFLYQGQYNRRQGLKRGTPSFGFPPMKFISFLQNHDQIANSLKGERIHECTSFGRFKAATAAMLLLPNTPMIFQGQEFGAQTPFYYFADHEPDLAKLVSAGRRAFLSQFASIKDSNLVIEPHDPEAFKRSKLNFDELDLPVQSCIFNLHKDLLELRKVDDILREQSFDDVRVSVLGAEAFLVRYFSEKEGDRLLLVNLGPDIYSEAIQSQPLLAPPLGQKWELLFTTEEIEYEGNGAQIIDENGEWLFSAHAAYFFRSRVVSYEL